MAIINGNSTNEILEGTAAADTIDGKGGNDVLLGFAGNDTLIGGDGDDTLEGGLGSDGLNGGPGIDWITYRSALSAVSAHLTFGGVQGFSTGGDGNDLYNSDIENIQGSNFNDFLWGDDGPNVLDSLGGNDQLAGKGGNDTLYGGAGSDALFGENGDDVLGGGAGDDRLFGGNGIDIATYFDAPSAVFVNLRDGFESTGTAGSSSGGAGNDLLELIEDVVGSDFNDDLRGNEGANTLWGGNGNDQLLGRGGDDILVGGEGNDSLFGVDGNDTLFGDNGNDLLQGGRGNDTLDGGAGIDTASFAQSGSGVSVNLALFSATGEGSDQLFNIENLTGSSNGDTLIGNSGANTIDGGYGNDVVGGGAGDDVMLGGDGIDTLTYATAAASVTVNLFSGTAQGGDGIDSFGGFENIVGSAFGDTLIGSVGDNTLDGGDGNDVLDGGFGTDVLIGGAGFDQADYRFFSGTLVASLASGTVSFPGFAGVETLSGIEGLLAGAGNDTLTGDGNNNTLGGGGGNDTLFGGAGNDVLIGDAGNDVLDGGAGNDLLIGDAGTDTASYAGSPAGVTADLSTGTASGDGSDTLVGIENLIGSNFADGLIGDSGNNVLSGGGGDDNLSAGGGNDTLIGGEGNDDLYSGSGNDILDGGSGTDEARYDRATSGVTVSLVSNTASGAGSDSLVNIEDLFGSPFNDTLTGNGGANAIGGGAGNDTLSGGAGIDVLTGGSGNDTLDGGSESDTAVYFGTRSLYTITAVPGGHTISSSAEGIDSLSNVEFAQFSDQTIALSSITVDTTPPTAQSFSPADEATGVPVASNIVVTFSEAIQRGTGNIVLRTSNDGAAVETFAAATASQLSISGSVLTINPSANLDFSRSYRVDFDNGSVKDLAGNAYTGTSTYNFITSSAPDTTAPTAASFSPADDATGVPVASNIVVTFSEAITRGTGTIVLRNAAGAAIETYQAATAAQISITGSEFTLNPSANLAFGAGYRVDFDFGSVKDLAGNSYAGTTTYNFNTASAPDTTAPTVTSFSPADEATGVAVASNIVLSFSEAIARGTGTIVLRNAAGTVIETFQAATAAQIGISGSTLTLNPSVDLAFAAGYRVDFDFGSVKDLAGNRYAGTTAYNFTTSSAPDSTAPTVQSFSPADEATGVAVASNIVLNFSEPIQRGTGTIVLRNAAGTVIEIFQAATAAQLSISGSELTINPSADLASGTGYRVDFDFGSFKDGAGNNYAGSTTYNFTTLASASTTPTPGNDLLTGTSGPDTIDALAGNDIINAGAGNDTLTGGPGADLINGGADIDTALYPGVRGDYLLSRNSQGAVTVSDRFGVMDTLTEVEFVQIGSDLIPTSGLGYLPAVTVAPVGVSNLVFRFYNTRDKAFFYTASVGERDVIILQSTDPAYTPSDPMWPYFYQGATFEQGHTSAGTSPVYRFYNTQTGHHFFTTSEAERENVFRESTDPAYGAPGPLWAYNFEGVAFQAYGSPGRFDSQTVFRFYSPTLDRHFFTASVEEAQEIRLTGVWNDEGVGFYGEVPG